MSKVSFFFGIFNFFLIFFIFLLIKIGLSAGKFNLDKYLDTSIIIQLIIILIWGFLTSAFCSLKRKVSSSFLLTSSILYLGSVGALFYLQTPDKLHNPVIFFLECFLVLYGVLQFFLSFIKTGSTKVEESNEGKHSVGAGAKTWILFVLILSFGHGGIFLFDRYYPRYEDFNDTKFSFNDLKFQRTAHPLTDNNILTYHEISSEPSSLKMDWVYEDGLAGFEILPGDGKKEAYSEFGRIRLIELEFASGKKIPIVVEDKNEIQRFYFKTEWTHFVKIHFKEFYPGKEPKVHIAELRPIRRFVTYFY